MAEDTARYNTLTLEISKTGAFSYLSSGGFLDHIVVSNELTDEYVPNSIMVYDPRTDIPSYTTTTSDHGPVVARFEIKEDVTLSTNDVIGKNELSAIAYPNPTIESFNVVVNLENTTDLQLNIYDVLGRSMGMPYKLNNSSNGDTTSINIAKLPAGIYIYTVSDCNKVMYRNKIVKK